MVYLIVFLEVIIALAAFYAFYIGPKLNPMNRGKKFLSEGNIDEALLEFNRAVENDPENHEAHFHLANLYLKKEVSLKVEEHFKRVLEINKFNQDIEKFDILQKLGKIQFEMNKLEKAFFSFKKVLEIYNSDYIANYHIGLIYAGQLLYDDAINYFKKTIKARPNDINARVNAALCLSQIDKLDHAINVLHEASKLAPDNMNIKFYLGIAFFISKSFKRSIEFLLEVLKNTEDKTRKYFCYRLIGVSYFFTGKFDNVKEIVDNGIEFLKLNSMIEEYKQILFDYCMFYVLKNEWKNASEKIMILHTIDSYFEYVDEIIEYLEFKQKSEQEEEEENIEDVSPAIASYYKAAQHVLGLKAEDNVEERQTKIMKDIKEWWMEDFIPDSFLWKLGGLTSSKPFNLKVISGKEKIDDIKEEAKKMSFSSKLNEFIRMDRQKFQNVGRNIISKLGMTIVRENFRPDLSGFVEGDGIDFVGKENDEEGKHVLIQIRRWDHGKVGEIPLRNMTQSMSVERTQKGIFIVPAELTTGAQKFNDKMKNISVYSFN